MGLCHLHWHYRKLDALLPPSAVQCVLEDTVVIVEEVSYSMSIINQITCTILTLPSPWNGMRPHATLKYLQIAEHLWCTPKAYLVIIHCMGSAVGTQTCNAYPCPCCYVRSKCSFNLRLSDSPSQLSWPLHYYSVVVLPPMTTTPIGWSREWTTGLCSQRIGPGLWTLDWVMDWTMVQSPGFSYTCLQRMANSMYITITMAINICLAQDPYRNIHTWEWMGSLKV